MNTTLKSSKPVILLALLTAACSFSIVQSGFAEEPTATIWTCAMHPEIKLTTPGNCPICYMELVPVSSQSSSPAATLTLTETAQKLSQIATTEVQRRFVEKELRLVGKVDFDETRLRHITAWVAGRIERMFVDYTGVTVNKGDHMVELYSPELLSAQEELIQATKSLRRLGSGASATVRRSTQQAAQASRDKLILWGLTEAQVGEIQKQGRAQDKVTVYAPSSGVVTERNATEGMYVETGTRIYTIADLSHVWVRLEAYESDLPWLRFGQAVEFTTRAIPGTVFTGRISFIKPFLSQGSRTTSVRVNVDNTGLLLKPGLFVTAKVKAKVVSTGKVIDSALQGKWISPMHPEIIRDEPGPCPVCGMALVPAEELGYVTETGTVTPPLVIPDTAPLITGTRAVVYVETAEPGSYQLREVVLGPRAGDVYIVESGLKEGERVVSRGAFKIDSDLQLRGEKSMMNTIGKKPAGGHSH